MWLLQTSLNKLSGLQCKKSATRWTKPRLKKQEKEMTVDENLKPVQDKQEPITITTPDGVVLTQVEFVDGELVPVMKTVKAKGTKTTKKQVF